MRRLIDKYIDWQFGECSQSEFIIACYEAGLEDTQIADVEMTGAQELWVMGIGAI